MSNIVIVCIVVVSLAFTALCVYAVVALIQITRTAKEAEQSVKKINYELEMFNEISQKAYALSQKVSAPLASAGSLALYLLTTFLKNKKNG